MIEANVNAIVDFIQYGICITKDTTIYEAEFISKLRIKSMLIVDNFN